MNKLEEYLKQVEEKIKELGEAKELKDRMEIHAAISELLYHFQGSLAGWAGWLQSASVMAKFSEKELKEFYNEMLKITKDFLILDVKATRVMLKKIEKKGKKKVKKRRNYVS